MTKEIEKARAGLETVKDMIDVAGVIIDTTAVAPVVSGAKIFWHGLAVGHRLRRRRQVERSLEFIANALDDGDTAGIGEALRDGVEWAWQTVEDGLRDVMAAIHEDAKKCVAVVVADYLKRRILPDREYRAAAEFFKQCDREFLDAALSLTAHFEQAVERTGGGRHWRLTASRGGEQIWWAAVADSHELEANQHFGTSDTWRTPLCFSELTQSLLRFEYSVLPPDPYKTSHPASNTAGHKAGITHAFLDAGRHVPRWHRLRAYMSPLRA